MNYKHACVIDSAGFYKTLVLVISEKDESGKVQQKIQSYTLKEGESVLDASLPVWKPYVGADGHIKPRWDGKQWVEGASSDEISAWEQQHPAPKPAPPTIDEVNTQAIAELSLVQAQQTAESNQAIAELSILIATGGTANV